jgi:hypothetical protein
MQMEPDKVHIFLIDEGSGQPAEAKAAMVDLMSRPGSNLAALLYDARMPARFSWRRPKGSIGHLWQRGCRSADVRDRLK